MNPLLFGTALAAVPPPKVDDPIPLPEVGSQDAALVIGNEDYQVLPDVPYALRDADAVAAAFVSSRGIPPERLVHLAGANREQMLDAVALLRERLGEGGTLWVYYAGHGAASPSTGELLLVGDDAKQDPTVFVRRSVSLSELGEDVSAPMVFVLDTCYAGMGRVGESLLPGTRFAVPAYAAPEDDRQRTVWTAAGPDQIAGAYDPARHGLFTYFVLGAMRGWADGADGTDVDQEVTVAEAHAYVGRSLAELGVNGQTPSLTTTGGAHPLVRGRALEDGPSVVGLARPGATPAGPGAAGAPARVTIPPMAEPFTWPLTHSGGRAYEDAYNAELRWGETLVPIARYDVDGQAAYRRWRRVGTAEALVAVTLGGVAAAAVGWGSWDVAHGNNLTTLQSTAIAGGGVAAIGGVVAWEIQLAGVRRSRAAEVLDAANRVVRGEAR